MPAYSRDTATTCSRAGCRAMSGLLAVHIKCKRNERLNVPEAMAQAVRDAERFQDGAPTVFHRRNRSGWLVTQRLEDWMEMHKNSYIKKEK